MNDMNGGYKRYDERQPTYSQQPYVNREQYYSDGEHGYYSQPGVTNEYSFNDGSVKGSVGKKIATAVLALIGVAAIGVTSIVAYTLVVGKNNPFTAPTPDSSINENVAEVVDDSSRAVDAPPVKRDDLPTLEQLAAPEDAMPIPEIIEKMSPSVVGITTITESGIATGSGIVLSEDGYIITNAHVIKDAQKISVVLPPYYGDEDDTQDDLTYTAENVGKDTKTDLAVLKIEKNGLKKAEIGKSEEVRVGELAIVIGNPLGLDLANTATTGIISAKDRTISVDDITMNVFQTDASINGGNSGGALINAYGQVIGITSAKVASADVEGLGFAIPIDNALPIVSDLMNYGYVTGRPSLGITGRDVTAAYSSFYGIPQGFLVETVTADSGSGKAGLQQKDIIIAINDNIVTGIIQLNEVKDKFKPGDEVTLTIYRSGKKLDLDVVLDEATGENTVETEQQQNNNYNNYNNYDPYDDYEYFDPFRYFGGF